MITNHYYQKINNAKNIVKPITKETEQKISKDALIGSVIGIGGLALIAIIGILIHH